MREELFYAIGLRFVFQLMRVIVAKMEKIFVTFGGDIHMKTYDNLRIILRLRVL